jgi:lactoylglutathione lyase
MTVQSTLKLGWVIVYVEDLAATSTFCEQAFGLRAEFAAPDGSYAQLDTGPTKLAFATHALGEKNFDGGVRHASLSEQPFNL